MSEILDIAAGFRGALLDGERAAAAALVRRYGAAWHPRWKMRTLPRNKAGLCVPSLRFFFGPADNWH